MGATAGYAWIVALLLTVVVGVAWALIIIFLLTDDTTASTASASSSPVDPGDSTPTPTVDPEPTMPPPIVSDSGTTALRLFNQSTQEPVTFGQPFSSEPVTVTAVIDNVQVFGTGATADLTVDSAAGGTVEVDQGNHPTTLPGNNVIANLGGVGATSAVFIDSNGEMWVATRNPSNNTQLQVLRGSGGFPPTSWSARTTAITFTFGSSFTGTSFFAETKGNVFLFSCGQLDGGLLGAYGPVSGTTLPNALTIFAGGAGASPLSVKCVVKPNDPDRMFIPFTHLNTDSKYAESNDGGINWTVTSLPGTGDNGAMDMVFYDDDHAIAVSETTGEVFGWYLDASGASAWTSRGRISPEGVSADEGRVAVVDGVVTVGYVRSDRVGAVIPFNNNDGTGGFPAPTLLGSMAGGTPIGGIHFGVSNGVCWLFCERLGNNLFGRYNDAVDLSGSWSSLQTIMASPLASVPSNMCFRDDGIIVSGFQGNNLVWNFIPTMAQVTWEVEGEV